MIFKVIDSATGKDVTSVCRRFLKEEWAKHLFDVDGFFINESGDLILADTCGNYRYCPVGRFTVKYEFLKEDSK